MENYKILKRMKMIMQRMTNGIGLWVSGRTKSILIMVFIGANILNQGGLLNGLLEFWTTKI